MINTDIVVVRPPQLLKIGFSEKHWHADPLKLAEGARRPCPRPDALGSVQTCH